MKEFPNWKFLVLAVMLIGMAAGWFFVYEYYASDLKDLSYYQKTYLKQSGYSDGFGNYTLRSLDGGKNWYAVDEEVGNVRIKGPAKQVYPGLLEHLAAIDKLIKYAEKNGPITFTGERAARDRQMLEKAGFELKKTK
jgi:hypothetical protein